MNRDSPNASRDVVFTRDRPDAASPTEAKTSPDNVLASRRPPVVPAEPTETPGGDPVLDEIDRVIEEVRTRRRVGITTEVPAPRTGSNPTDEPESATTDFEEPGGAPSGYLEEHLIDARLSVANMDEEIARLETSSKNLRQRVTTVESDLDRITGEYRFVRNHGWMADPAARIVPPLPPWAESAPNEDPRVLSTHAVLGSSGSPTPARLDLAASSSPVYREFTVDRYNRTIDTLKGRSATLVAITLLLSAAIGAVLVAVVLFSPAVDPPIWVAALPLVWMVPVPYFLYSFRGTHRVLQRNHLNLPEEQ
jgi:hypothetical protein